MERVVLVTGAGSGFGMATATTLSSLGFTTVGLVSDARQGDVLNRAAATLGVGVEVIEADLADPAQRESAIKDRDLYALVNNAGYLNAGLLRDVGIDDARRQLEVMVLAPLDLAQRALPHMLRRGEGRIVNVTSAAVHTATDLRGWYQASKAALRGLNDALRLELASTGIDVIDIQPGRVRPGIWDREQGGAGAAPAALGRARCLRRGRSAPRPGRAQNRPSRGGGCHHRPGAHDRSPEDALPGG